jgi:hypothetical protein
MAGENGRYVGMSLARKWIADLMHFTRGVPVVGGERVLRLRAAADARKAAGLAVGWQAMIVKGLGIVSQRVPEFRRAYMPFPWPRMYEAPYSVATIILDREYQGEHATFLAPVLHPERLPLPELQQKLDKLKTAPVHEVGPFRRLIRTTKWPLPVRRLLWRVGLYGGGLLRARNFGTFAVNSVAAFRGRMLTMRTPITSCLYYNAVSRDGEMPVQLAFDHRVFDGYTAGRVLSELEQVLNTEIAAEVAAPGRSDRAAA